MMMSSNTVDHTKIPIWIGKDCKVVTGINKSTTCQNVIQTLITDNPTKFVIVEKWKKMERRLDGSVRILKVWKAWGDQKDDVALILRPHHANDGYIDKKTSNKVSRRNKSSQLHKLTNHDEKMEEGGEGVREPMERLLTLVLTQGETIQAQLKKLRHQEEQIERYEEEMHRIRRLKEGENYVVESYLRDDKGKKLRKRDKSPRKSGWLKQHHSNNHSHHHHRHNHSRETHHHQKEGDVGEKIMDVSSPPVQITEDQMNGGEGTETEEYLREQSELMERICELNHKLTKEEETLVKLGLKIKKYYERHKDENEPHHQEEIHQGEGEGENCQIKRTSGHTISRDEEEEQELRHLVGQVELLRENTNEQFNEIALNEQSLNELEQILDSKNDHVDHLTYQIQLVDEESEYLRQRLLKITHGFPPRPYPHHYHPVSSDSPISSQPQEPSPESTVTSQDSRLVEKPSPIIGTQQIIPCDSSATSINFPCSIPTTTQLNLHIKPCRDHQDNDSNSDTGISSLHSSSDENTLFVLDTLV